MIAKTNVNAYNTQMNDSKKTNVDAMNKQI